MTSSVYFSLNDCYLSFGKKKILDNVSISLHEEDKIALVGKNGAGKTSLLKIISGAINIDSGDILFDSKIKVGFLNQMLVMKNNSKIYDSLNSMLDSEDKKYFIDHVCNELKLNTNNNIKELSGGEHRKFNLASILIKNPDLLLLDEPTNHLDIESIKWLEDYLNKSFRGAFLVTSHDRNFLKNVTNKVLWIDRNKIKLSPKGFLNFEKWSRDLIEQERRELGNKKKILNEELEWLSK